MITDEFAQALSIVALAGAVACLIVVAGHGVYYGVVCPLRRYWKDTRR